MRTLGVLVLFGAVALADSSLPTGAGAGRPVRQDVDWSRMGACGFIDAIAVESRSAVRFRSYGVNGMMWAQDTDGKERVRWPTRLALDDARKELVSIEYNAPIVFELHCEGAAATRWSCDSRGCR